MNTNDKKREKKMYMMLGAVRRLKNLVNKIKLLVFKISKETIKWIRIKSILSISCNRINEHVIFIYLPFLSKMSHICFDNILFKRFVMEVIAITSSNYTFVFLKCFDSIFFFISAAGVDSNLIWIIRNRMINLSVLYYNAFQVHGKMNS